MLYRLGHHALRAGTAAILVMVSAGCGSGGGPSPTQSELNTTMGERLGALVAEAVQESDARDGEVVLVHLSRSKAEAAQWIKGLKQGLGADSLVVLGREQLPAEVIGGMGGFLPLEYALQQHPNAAAIITTLPVGAYERPNFPENHPPIYALGWSYLPDSIYLFKSKHLVAGVFEQANPTPRSDGDTTLSPAELFDRNYVVVTAENLRKEVNLY